MNAWFPAKANYRCAISSPCFPGIVIELEVPQRSLALAGVSPIDRLRPCVEAARSLLSQIAHEPGNSERPQ